jgi:hypothetical protein
MNTIKKNQWNSSNRGGRRPGAGRLKGIANKRTREIANQVMASGQSPLEFMLSVMRNPKNPTEMWMEAAVKAAPFCHARLQAIQHTGSEGEGIQNSIEVVFV